MTTTLSPHQLTSHKEVHKLKGRKIGFKRNQVPPQPKSKYTPVQSVAAACFGALLGTVLLFVLMVNIV